MHRSFSLRRHRSQPLAQISPNIPTIHEAPEGGTEPERPNVTRGLSKKLLRRFHSRNPMRSGSDSNGQIQTAIVASIDGNKMPGRSLSRREKLVHVIANPDSLFKQENNNTRETESRFNPDPKSLILRTFFSPNIDFAPSVPAVYASQRVPNPAPRISSLEPDEHIFDSALLPAGVIADLPPGYSIRSLTRGDFNRGFLEVLRVSGKIGYVSSKRWDERCEWLQKRAQESEEYIVVILEDKRDRVVGVGRWIADRGFMNNLATNGRIDDIAVARDQKGKRMGLRLLESLVHVSTEMGCHRTVVNCSEANEAFHGQLGFVKEGAVMILQHGSVGSRRGESIVS